MESTSESLKWLAKTIALQALTLAFAGFVLTFLF